MRDIRELTFDEMTEYVKSCGQPAYRAKQLYDWLHVHTVTSFEEMSNLPATLKKRAAEDFGFYCPYIKTQRISAQDGSMKFLFVMHDGQMIESVFMPYHHGNSVCISSQAGCRMGCRFCASTVGGLVRNLTAAEMLGQVYGIMKQTGERVSNIVIMGTGEPLDNYDNVLRFIKMLTDEHGLNISQRNVTLSTCGLAEGIMRLAKEKLQITLALSLHAATDEKRRTIMPVANRYSIDELMEAVAFYADTTGRRVTFEYSLIEGVNDGDEDAAKLGALAKRAGAHVNLIPVNPVRGRDFCPPGRRKADVFKNKLEKNRINVTIRRSMGRDIEGACGQLRRAEQKIVEPGEPAMETDNGGNPVA